MKRTASKKKLLLARTTLREIGEDEARSAAGARTSILSAFFCTGWCDTLNTCITICAGDCSTEVK